MCVCVCVCVCVLGGLVISIATVDLQIGLLLCILISAVIRGITVKKRPSVMKQSYSDLVLFILVVDQFSNVYF